MGLMSCPEIEGYVPARRLAEACRAANIQAYIAPLVVLILECSESVAQDTAIVITPLKGACRTPSSQLLTLASIPAASS